MNLNLGFNDVSSTPIAHQIRKIEYVKELYDKDLKLYDKYVERYKADGIIKECLQDLKERGIKRPSMEALSKLANLHIYKVLYAELLHVDEEGYHGMNNIELRVSKKAWDIYQIKLENLRKRQI